MTTCCYVLTCSTKLPSSDQARQAPTELAKLRPSSPGSIKLDVSCCGPQLLEELRGSGSAPNSKTHELRVDSAIIAADVPGMLAALQVCTTPLRCCSCPSTTCSALTAPSTPSSPAACWQRYGCEPTCYIQCKNVVVGGWCHTVPCSRTVHSPSATSANASWRIRQRCCICC